MTATAKPLLDAEATRKLCERVAARSPVPEVEVLVGEILPVVGAVNFAMKNLKKWIKPRKVKKPVNMLGIDTISYFQSGSIDFDT